MDVYYSRKMYDICYSFSICPTNGIDMWPKVDADELHPHLYKKIPKRPKKLRFRKLGKGGSRLSRVGVTFKCTKCDKMGHNSIMCKETTQNPYALKRKVKFNFVMLLAYIMSCVLS